MPCLQNVGFFAPDMVNNIWEMHDTGDDGNRAGVEGIIKIGI